jgi:hypothetical protein
MTRTILAAATIASPAAPRPAGWSSCLAMAASGGMVELPRNGSIVAIWVNNIYDLKVEATTRAGP